MSKLKALALAGTALVGLAAMPTPAHAILQIAADIGGTIFTCQDQASCDTNLAVGQLAIADQVIGGVQFLGSAQTQTIGGLNKLNTSSFQVINTTGGVGNVAITLAISGINFAGPVETFSASGGGTFETAIGSNFQLSFYADTANGQGARSPLDTPGALMGQSAVNTATLVTQSFLFNTSGAFVDPDLFSMTLLTTGLLTDGGSLVGRTQTMVTEQVVEPESLGLLGAGLLGLGGFSWVNRKRNRKYSGEFAAA